MMQPNRTQSQITVTVVYDDHPFDPRFRLGSGFACLIRIPSGNFLFDTGAHGPTLLRNLDAAAVPPPNIDTIVMSHLDSDHSGGLFDFLDIHPAVRVYLLRSVPNAFKERLRKLGATVLEVARRSAVARDLYSFGHIGNCMSEQSLGIYTPEEVVLLVADVHPGILEVIRQARCSMHRRIDTILGGFHLEGNNETELGRVATSLQRLGVTRVAPCHSTGEPAMRIFKAAYGNRFLQAGVGMELKFMQPFARSFARARRVTPGDTR